MGPTVLLVEDESEAAARIAAALREASDRFEVETVPSAHAAQRSVAAQRFDCVVLDYRLPDTDGFECLRRLRIGYPELPIIVVTGVGSQELAVEAMKLGATDYVVKEGRYAQRVPGVVRQALGVPEHTCYAARRRLGSRRQQADALAVSALDAIAGTSAAIEAVRAQVREHASGNAPVLIRGETGTGKELVAAAIHYTSARRGNLVAVNCAAVTESLFENEFFGHVQGAFTGASTDRPGLMKEADGGTLFLDEIGDLPLAQQPKLLRALDSGSYRPVGGTRELRSDMRIVAATNRPLGRLAREGKFREDLYFRLHAVSICIPPLRERIEDIRVLARLFLARHDPGGPARVADEAMGELLGRPWRGNVRELDHVVYRTLVSNRSGPITRFVRADDDEGEAIGDAVCPPRDERAELIALLVHHRGRLQPVAQALGVCVRTVQRRMDVLGLDRRDFRKPRL